MATALKGRGIGLLLTGMGDDGAQGLLRMRRLGARTAVQDKTSCAVFGMPRAALEVGATDRAMPVEGLAAWAVELCRGVTPAPSSAPTRKRRVLIVDDDHAALEFTRRALEQAGYDAQSLDNPMMVAVALRRTPADLVLLESELVTMSGKVVTEALRNNGLGGVPVMLYSSLDQELLRTRAAECGVLGFLHKGDPALLDVMRSLIGGPEKA